MVFLLFKLPSERLIMLLEQNYCISLERNQGQSLSNDIFEPNQALE